MKFLCPLLLAAGLSLSAIAQYPVSKKVDSVDVFFGKSYPDPYRWMENLSDQGTIDWFKAQDNYAQSVINKMPLMETMVEENRAADKIRSVKYGGILKRNGIWFFDKRTPGQQRFRIYTKAEGEEPKELFNSEEFEKGKYEVSAWAVSHSGAKMVLHLSEPGKEKGVLRILDVKTKTLSPDSIVNASYPEWVQGKDMFFYTQSGSSNVHSMENTLNSKLMVYDNGKRTEVLSNTHDPSLGILPEDYPFISFFKDGNYMLAGKGTVDNNQEVFYAPASEFMSGKINWKPFCKREDKIRSFYIRGNDVYVLSSKTNPNIGVYRYTITDAGIGKPVPVYEPKTDVVQSIGASKNYLIISSLVNGIATKIQSLSFADKKLSQVNTGLTGMVYLFGPDDDSDELIAANSSWTAPFNFYSYNVATKKLSDSYFYTKLPDFGGSNFVSEEVEVTSHDGVKVPLSIVYDKSLLKKDGSNICYMDAYGAYGSVTTPYFSFLNLSMLKRGVILAFPHVRGGGELGEKWHMAGYKTTKPNTWKDFIACAEYLVKNKYTNPERLAGTGTSAGGILIGRAITERPDLFRAAILRVGCMSMVRQEFSPNGPVNVPEFGTVKKEDEAAALAEMDAVLHVKPGVKYPAMLITTGFNDPRVISWSPGKFAAAVQNSNASAHPILLKVNYAGGHFGGANAEDWIRDYAMEKAFILWQCGYTGK